MIGAQAHPLRAIAPSSTLETPELHPDHEEIDRQVISYLVNTWEWPSEKAKEGFVSWKLNEVVLFMFPTGNPERVQLACELLLLGFLMDDWFDNHSFSINAAVVSRLQNLLSSPSTFQPTTTVERMHTDIFNRIRSIHPISLPPSSSHAILKTYIDMLACHCDPSRGQASTLGEYLVFREVDVGMPICQELLYWTEDLAMTPEETNLLAPGARCKLPCQHTK